MFRMLAILSSWCSRGQLVDWDGGHDLQDLVAGLDTLITTGLCCQPVCRLDGCEGTQPSALACVAGRDPDEAEVRPSVKGDREEQTYAINDMSFYHNTTSECDFPPLTAPNK